MTIILKKQEGFTLAETVVYIAVMGVVIGGIIAIMVQLVKLKSSADSMRIISNETTNVFEEMSYDIRNADSFSVVDSTRINIVKDSNNYTYYLADGQILLDDGSEISPVTTNMVQIDSFEIVDWTTVNSDDLVHIRIQLSRGNIDESFQTSVHDR